MRSKLVVGARALMGLIFVVFGLNFFLHFIPQPPPPAPRRSLRGRALCDGILLPRAQGDRGRIGSPSARGAVRTAGPRRPRPDHHQHPPLSRVPRTCGSPVARRPPRSRALPRLVIPERLPPDARRACGRRRGLTRAGAFVFGFWSGVTLAASLRLDSLAFAAHVGFDAARARTITAGVQRRRSTPLRPDPDGWIETPSSLPGARVGSCPEWEA